MEEGIDVALLLLTRGDKYGRIARLVATMPGEGAEAVWSGDAMLHLDRRTGKIALGTVILPCSAPLAVRNALHARLLNAWHHGGDVRIVGPDWRPLSGAEAVAALRALCPPVKHEHSTRAGQH